MTKPHESGTAALREDLALALRAAAHHGLSEGVCNHFSVALPDDTRRFLINPRGLHWSEVGADDIVLVDEHGTVLAGRHRVEPTGRPLASVNAKLSAQVAEQIQGEREQSDLFFEALRRVLPAPGR